MRQTVRVALLKNSARLCECGRVASYRVTVSQLSGEGRTHAANLILCGVCWRIWLSVEGYELAAQGLLDTTCIDDRGDACYRRFMSNTKDSEPKSSGYVRETGAQTHQPLPARVNKLLAELRDVLLRSPHLDKGGQVIIHVAPGRGELKLQLPPEVKKF